jgi:hypothetical protein
MKKIVLLIVLISSVAVISAGQEREVKSRKEIRKEKAEKIAGEVRDKINSKDFEFVVNQALPMGGGSIQLTSRYDLKLKGDSATSFLPYFGVAYRADYGSSEGGIKFNQPVKEYKNEFRKSNHEISFSVYTPQDNYTMHLVISNSGNGTLGVTCNNRQFISFTGSIELKSE